MRSILITAVLIALSVLKADDINFLNPKIPGSIVTNWIQESEELWTSKIDIASELVTVNATARFDATNDRIRFSGIYTTKQKEIVEDSKLTFQLYDHQGSLTQFENPRAALNIEGRAAVAEFDFSIPTLHLNHEKQRNILYFKFNYVLEGSYWYHDKHDALYRPAIAFQNLGLTTRFEKRAFFTAPIAPAHATIYSVSIVNILRTNLERNINYRQSVEARSDDLKKRIDHPRKVISKTTQGSTLLLNSYTFGVPGKFLVRQGFVWENVRWYDIDHKNDYSTVQIVSVTLYTFLVFITVVVSFCFSHFANNPRLKRFRFALLTFAVLTKALLVYLCTFNQLGFLFLGFLGSLLLIKKVPHPPLALHTTYFLPLATQEIYWSVVFTKSPISLQGIALSLLFYALILFPLTFVKKPLFRIVTISLLAIFSLAMYSTINAYFSFFTDYPSIGTFGNTNQVGDITDSIAALIDERYFLPILFWIPSFIWTAKSIRLR